MSIVHNTDKKLFTVDVDDDTAYLAYRQADEKTLEFFSTYVPDEFRGKGIAGRLARTALDYARDNGYRVQPTCSFVVSFLEKHREYSDILAGSDKDETND